MHTRKHSVTGGGEAGFSMVEMLMTTFILAIGLLGLCMLQTMSLRASRGSRSLSTAIELAEGVMGQIEMEGRLSWLNITNSNNASTSIGNLNGLLYFPVIQSPQIYYDGTGKVTDVNHQFYAVTVTETPGPAFTTGLIADFKVQVVFSDSVNSLQAAVPRTFTLTRRITHG